MELRTTEVLIRRLSRALEHSEMDRSTDRRVGFGSLVRQDRQPHTMPGEPVRQACDLFPGSFHHRLCHRFFPHFLYISIIAGTSPTGKCATTGQELLLIFQTPAGPTDP